MRFAPFHCTCDVPTKLPPFTVSVKAPDVAVTVAGEMVVTAGVGLLIAKAAPADVPPPGAGLTTVIAAVPEAATSVAVIAAVNCVALTYVVARFAPFHCTWDTATKPLPVRVRVNAADPTALDAGRIEATAGMGFAVIANAIPADVPPPGAALATVTVAVPAVATSAAGMAAVSCVALT